MFARGPEFRVSLRTDWRTAGGSPVRSLLAGMPLAYVGILTDAPIAEPHRGQLRGVHVALEARVRVHAGPAPFVGLPPLADLFLRVRGQRKWPAWSKKWRPVAGEAVAILIDRAPQPRLPRNRSEIERPGWREFDSYWLHRGK